MNSKQRARSWKPPAESGQCFACATMFGQIKGGSDAPGSFCVFVGRSFFQRNSFVFFKAKALSGFNLRESISRIRKQFLVVGRNRVIVCVSFKILDVEQYYAKDLN